METLTKTVLLEKPIELTGVTCEESARHPGIYGIKNTQNGKIYIGSSINRMDRRWQTHDSRLKNGKHANPHLVAAFAKYGRDAFEYLVLEVVEDLDTITEREQWWIDKMRESSPGIYNMMPAERHLGGQVFTDEHRANLSKALKGRVVSEETRKKIGDAHRGMKMPPVTEEWLEKNREIGRREYPAFIHADSGEVIPTGIGLKRLCVERDFSYQCMRNVCNGRSKVHKGWRLVDDAIWHDSSAGNAKGLCRTDEPHKNSKLNWEIVDHIRSCDTPARQLAKEYGVSTASVCNARRYKTWRTGEEVEKDVSKEAVLRRRALAKFWAKVDKGGEGECWEWTGGPTLSFLGKSGSPARISWFIENGEMAPKGKIVRRTCGNIKCVNPQHLCLSNRKIDSKKGEVA